MKSGDVWTDTRGVRIDAHGGGILLVAGVFFWFGTDYTPGKDPAKRYVSCYSSPDLIHWTYHGDALQLSDPDQLGTKWVVERPKVYYNARSRRFVMYFHIDNDTNEVTHFAQVGVAVSRNVSGPYTFVRTFRPLNHESRDIGQFVDDDGKAYLIFESRPTNGFYIAELTADYLGVKKVTSFVPVPLEAGALVHLGNWYYVVGSHMTGWSANPNVYAVSHSIHGPWSAFANIARSETNTYGSQATMLLKIKGSRQTQVIYMGDIWEPQELWDSRYLWMPLDIGNGRLILPRPQPWSINVSTGTVQTK